MPVFASDLPIHFGLFVLHLIILLIINFFFSTTFSSIIFCQFYSGHIFLHLKKNYKLKCIKWNWNWNLKKKFSEIQSKTLKLRPDAQSLVEWILNNLNITAEIVFFYFSPSPSPLSSSSSTINNNGGIIYFLIWNWIVKMKNAFDCEQPFSFIPPETNDWLV